MRTHLVFGLETCNDNNHCYNVRQSVRTSGGEKIGQVAGLLTLQLGAQGFKSWVVDDDGFIYGLVQHLQHASHIKHDERDALHL